MPPVDGVLAAHEQTAVAALSQGRPVVVQGPWGSGRTQLLRRLQASFRGALLGVDDVHLLTEDETARLARRLVPGSPAVLTATRGSRLRPGLRRAITSCGALVIDLAPATLDQVATLTQHRSGVRPPDAALSRLTCWSGGILRFLDAIVEDGLAQGWLTADGATSSVWPETLEPGPALRTAVDGLLDSLTRREREVLTSLMSTGPVPVPVADDVFPAGPLDALQANGLVEERPGDEAADLVLTAAALYDGAGCWLTPRRQRAALGTIAAGVGELHLHQLSLHQRVRVARWATAAGPVALVRQGVGPSVLVGDLDSAVELGRYVMARDPEDRQTRETVVMALEASGDHDRAVAQARHDPLVDDASSLARLAANVYLSTLDETTARDLVQDSVPGRDDDGEATANLGWLKLFTGDVDEVTAASSTVLHADSSSSQARVWSCVQYAVAEVISGGAEVLDILDVAGRILLARSEDLTPYSAFQVDWTRCVALVRLGRAEEVLPVVSAALASTEDPQLASAWHGVAGLASRELGDFEGGLAHFEAISDSLSGDPFGLGTWAASEHQVCSSMLERLDGPSSGISPIGFTESLLKRNAAWCAAVDDREGAAAMAAEAAGLAHARGQSTIEMLALVDMARFGLASTASARAAEVSRVENPLIRAGGRVVSAIARNRAGELLAAADVAAEVGWRVAQAELLVLARKALLTDGRPTMAALVEVCAGRSRWPTPILTRKNTPRFVTEREREVGALAAGSVRSEVIAERLGISRRTVDNLLGRLYHKCGVNSRLDLSAAIAALRGV